jgi:hypothetical protein
MVKPVRNRDSGFGFLQTTNHQPPTNNQLTNDKNWIPELVRNDRELKQNRERVKERTVNVFDKN